jgi:hypothetical protein
MRIFLSLMLAGLLLDGCASSKTPKQKPETGWPKMDASDMVHPMKAEALGLAPRGPKNADEAKTLSQEATLAFSLAFNHHLPKSFALDGPAIGWFNDTNQLKQLRTTARISRSEFNADFPSALWAEIPVPPEYLSSMGLAANVSHDEMTCFLGQLNHHPAYLFWSAEAETAMLVADY